MIPMSNFEVIVESYRLLDSVSSPVPADISKEYSRALSACKSLLVKCVCLTYQNKKSELRK